MRRFAALLASGGMFQVGFTNINGPRIQRPSRPKTTRADRVAAAETQQRINNNNAVTAQQQKEQQAQQAINSLWPFPPLHGMGYQLTAGGATFALGAAVVGPAPTDTVKVDLPPAGLAGVLVYSWENSAAGALTQYLVFRGVGGKYETAPVKPYASVHYQWQQALPLRDLKFTGSGNALFLNSASDTTVSASSTSTASTVLRWGLLDSTFNGTNARVPSSSLVRYSTDGKYTAVTAPATDDSTPQNAQQPWKEGGDGWLEVTQNSQPYLGTSDGQWTTYLTALNRYPEYSTSESQDTSLQGLPVWRVSNHAAVRDMVWTPRGHLLYTHEGTTPAITGTAEPEAPEQFPSIWLANPEAHTNVKIIDRGYDPTPSPDGHWLAFYGWPSSITPTTANPAPAPTLSFYNGQSKTGFHVAGSTPAVLRWTPDGKTLVMASYSKDGNTVELSTMAVPAAVPTQDTPLAPAAKLATIRVRDPMGLGATRPAPAAITVDGISSNGNYLLVELSEFTATPGTVGSEERTLEAVDLTSGAQHVIAKVTPPVGTKLNFSWTWFEMT